MSLNSDEQKLLEVFQKSNLLDGQNFHPFCDFFQAVVKRDYANRREVLELSKKIKNAVWYQIQHNGNEMAVKNPDRLIELNDMYWKTLLIEAQNRQVDSYFLYLEKNRDPKDKFYQPRRRKFVQFGLTQALQGMIDDKFDILCLSMPPGTAKAQPLYSKVLTPSGFVRMGDISVGDTVIAGNGNYSKVIGVYPQGIKPVYEVTFDDGSKCRCSDEHLWKVQTRCDRRNGSEKYRVVPLSDIMKNIRVENGKRLNYSIDYVKKIEYRKKDLLIHPYVLGVLIGDGNIYNGLKISLPDEEVKQKFSSLLPLRHEIKHIENYDYRINSNVYYTKGKGELRKSLEYYGLYNTHSYEKFIPRDYLYSSYEDRLELLRGLFDTDGCANKAYANYSTSSLQLAKDVIELVHSLGGYASCKKKKSGYRGKTGEYIQCRDSYNIIAQFNSSAPNPFYLSRKANIYKPKRDIIKRFIKDIQYVGQEQCQCIMIDDPCHLYITDDYIITHNTTAEKFFNTGVIGWFPKDYNLFYSHSGDITRMYYDSTLQIVTDNQEYTWSEIFPGLTVSQTNAKMQQFNVSGYKPFPSLQTASVGSENAGKVRASKYLLVDDMVGKLEEALNKNILDKLWSAYAVDARQRKTNDSEGKFCKEIHIATRWSVHDVIGRLKRIYEGNPRVKFIAIPATYIDPKTGVEKSNFDYDIGGFTVENFHDQQLVMDDISYKCLYMQEPIEREGLLYHEDDVRRYLTLPLKEPEAILGICDTKNTGSDYMFVPCFKKYGDDYYLVDCVCDNTTNFDVLFEKIVNLIIDNKMQMLEIESNQGGRPIATTIKNMLKERKWDCNITEKPTETNKEARIIANSHWVKHNVLFKDKSEYSPKDDYGIMMSQLFSWSAVGKNANDDVPDGLANFRLFVSHTLERRQTVIIESPI